MLIDRLSHKHNIATRGCPPLPPSARLINVAAAPSSPRHSARTALTASAKPIEVAVAPAYLKRGAREARRLRAQYTLGRMPQHPAIDDLIGGLSGARWFSKVDLRSSYHQLMLAKESR
ncbi:hypothetical protein NDU88_003137 [Pleurodeles waltl]|uniref:Uncharacterized protein n=1 Tax=Pleurodeles waltl TaxID=8319 RepID=A0AAV7P8R0_PLEWA|nr:hypothetical protein NDU88_003137 [Pleurodeles waltl]